MGERPTIAFRVDEEQKDEWKEYADDHDEYDSLSHFIRVAVAHEMSDAYGPQGGGGGGASDVEGANVGELVTKVEKMEGELSDLAQSVESATRAMHSGGGVSEDTLSAVWDALPKGPDRATTAEGVAEGLDVDVSTVRLALEQLHETTSTVRKREAQETEGEVTITDERGRELGHGGSKGIIRRNPLWFKVEK